MGTIPLISTSHLAVLSTVLQHAGAALVAAPALDASQAVVIHTSALTFPAMTTIVMSNYGKNPITWASRIAGHDFHIDSVQAAYMYDNLPGGTVPATPVGPDVKRFSATFGTAALLVYPITHNHNTLDVNVEVYQISTGETVLTLVNRVDVNTIQISVDAPPGVDTLRAVVLA